MSIFSSPEDIKIYSRNIDHWGYEQFNDGTSQSMDTGEFKVKCTGYQYCLWKYYLVHFFSIIFLCIPYLLLRWCPQLMVELIYYKCQLKEADAVIIKYKSGHIDVCHVSKDPIIHFDYQYQRYYWNEEKQAFQLLQGVTGSLMELVNTSQGISQQQREKRLETFGPNVIVVQIKSIFKILADEVINPLYLFELVCVLVWLTDEYYYYSLVIIIWTLCSLGASLYHTRKENKNVQEMVDHANKIFVTVLNDRGKCEIIDSINLVPGDIIEIASDGYKMTCDALLLTGNCIVNESSLTGESTPVTKVPPIQIDEEYEHLGAHARNTLYCGTTVIQTRFYDHNTVTALVVRTGSMTAKGQLVKSILFPKVFGFDFYKDAIRFVFVMFIIALAGCTYSFYLFLLRGSSLETILIRSLDIITIVVPPTLPAAMTVGTLYAQQRLRNKHIFCISPSRINVAGKVKLVCFDKTGTLTEEGLSVWGILTPNGETLEDTVKSPSDFPPTSPLLQAMTCCHTLTKMNTDLCGDPLDLAMFQSTGWDMEEPGFESNRFDQLAPIVVRPRKWQFINANAFDQKSGSNSEHGDIKIPYEIAVLKQYPFSSSVQCMSVIARTLGAKTMTVYTKGAPEKILQMCDKSTVPKNTYDTLSYYTSSGYRVIAVAYKLLPSNYRWIDTVKATRISIENNVKFLGLILMQNNLKLQSAPVIKELQNADIRCLMLTGDNLLTAISVSRECGLVSKTRPLSRVVVTFNPQPTVILQSINSSSSFTYNVKVESCSALVIDGPTWSHLKEFFPSLLPIVATRCVVFARMSPQQKTNVVETLQSLDYIVMMVGDGANDCGALRAAHIGISLSTTEISIAAPFTSKTPDITCVPKLILEGRCSLVTSFGIFNFMELYSLYQFSSVIILYMIGSEMGTNQFLYVDLFITTVLAVVMGKAGPSERLSKYRPISRLLSLSNIIPLILQVLLGTLVQYLSLYLLQNQSWYIPVEKAKGDEEVVLCWEVTSVYLVSCFQYLILAIVYSKGRPHREPIYKNWMLMATVSVLLCVNMILLFMPWNYITDLFELMPISYDETFSYRFFLVCLPIAQFFISLFVEHNLRGSFWFKWCCRKILMKNESKKKYKTLENQINNNSCFWDPFSI